MPESNRLPKIVKILSAIVILIALGFLIWFLIDKYRVVDQKNLEQKALKNVEKISYITQLPFDSQKLVDTTKITLGEVESVTPEIGKTFSELKVDKGNIVVPANSEVRVAFKTFCLDHSYSAPDVFVPTVFSYEKIDMPLFSEIEKYIMEQSNIDQPLVQDLIWNLSAEEKTKFDQLSEEDQALLLKINPSAKEIIDSYQYYRNISVKSLAFGENLPDDVVAQPVPGTELYAKVNSTLGGSHSFDYTEIDLYNPSAEPQNLPMVKEGEGILVLMPKDSVRKIDVDGFVFGVLSGKFDINNDILKTPADAGVVLLSSQDGKKFILGPKTEISLSDLAKKLSQSDETSFLQTFQAQTANAESSEGNWDGGGYQRKGADPQPPECKVQCKPTLCEVVCVRG